MTYGLLNKLTAKPGKREEVIGILLESGKLMDDSACLMYMVSEAADDPNVIYVTDLWTSKDLHRQALQAPELRGYIDKAIPLLEGMPEQTEIRPVGGTGVPG
jgi:quinol monooxygenase YgiN